VQRRRSNEISEDDRDDLARLGLVGGLRGSRGARLACKRDVGRARRRGSGPDENLPLTSCNLLDIDQLLDEFIEFIASNLQLAPERTCGEPALLLEDLAGPLQFGNEAHADRHIVTLFLMAIVVSSNRTRPPHSQERHGDVGWRGVSWHGSR